MPPLAWEELRVNKLCSWWEELKVDKLCSWWRQAHLVDQEVMRNRLAELSAA